jgi:hypothetical protein
MTKFIFILFLFFCSLHAFSQKDLPNTPTNKSDISDKLIKIEKEDIEIVYIKDLNETEIELLLKDNLCEILSIKVSDLLNESMLKKLTANA